MPKTPGRKKYRKPSLCKPCWELKYCPYGVIVETMPLPYDLEDKPETAPLGETWDETYARALRTLKNADFTDENDVWGNMTFVQNADPMKRHHLSDLNPDDVRCRIFGHVCPVFFYAYSDITETRELRVHGRHVPRDIMLKVVRRDNQCCRKCGKPVPDEQIEFDHVIPHAKGGPMSVENIRLLCRSCNRKKSDSLVELLDPADDQTD